MNTLILSSSSLPFYTNSYLSLGNVSSGRRKSNFAVHSSLISMELIIDVFIKVLKLEWKGFKNWRRFKKSTYCEWGGESVIRVLISIVNLDWNKALIFKLSTSSSKSFRSSQPTTLYYYEKLLILAVNVSIRNFHLTMPYNASSSQSGHFL